MKTNKIFTVYFEVFGVKKKFIVDNEMINSQKQAEEYVSIILIPDNTKFYDSKSFLKETGETKEKESESINEMFERLSKNFNSFWDNFKNKI